MRKGTQIVRGRYSSLKLRELSAVTIPAQEGALVTIIKAGQTDPQLSEVMKFYTDKEEGYRTFAELLSDNERRARYWEAQEEIYPLITAVTDSIRSVIADEQIEWATKQALLKETVDAFLEAMAAKGPEIEAELFKLLNEGASEMTDQVAKKLADTEAELAKAQQTIAKMSDDMKEMETEKEKTKEDMAAMAAEMDEMKKSSDEILKVGQTEIRKSEVGPSVFAVMKAQEDRAVLAELAKVADTDYGYLPGTAVEKAAVLKASQSFDEATRSTFETLLKAANAALEPAFQTIGKRGGAVVSVDARKAKDDYNAEVKKLVDGGMKNVDAFRKVRQDHPELFKAMQEADKAA